jgi:uncharacterized DUF497 family protein
MKPNSLNPAPKNEWNAPQLSKNRNNKKKYGIDFEMAQLVFNDPRCISFVERVNDGLVEGFTFFRP